MGRPLLDIDEDQVRKLASIFCTYDEIASVMGCSKDTLEHRFSAVIKEGKEQGKASLRRLQWISAQNGNVVMQIWLGKQMLGQRDMPPDESMTPEKMPVIIRFNADVAQSAN